MPRGLHFEADCLGKKKMDKGTARRLMTTLRSKGRAVDFYKCNFCGKYHIGGK